jgi:hypothetical protein
VGNIQFSGARLYSNPSNDFVIFANEEIHLVVGNYDSAPNTVNITGSLRLHTPSVAGEGWVINKDLTSLFVGGKSEFSSSLHVSSSISASTLHLTDIATLSPIHPLPSGNTGSLVVSESFGYSNLYLHNGNGWVVIQTGSIS